MKTQTILTILISIVFLVWLGKPEIKLNPLSIKLNAWREMLAVIFLMLSLTMYKLQIKKEADKEALEYVNKRLKQEVKQLKLNKELKEQNRLN